MEQITVHLNACYFGIIYKDKGSAHVGDYLGLSPNTRYNYKRAWPPTQQQLNGIYNRVRYVMDRQASEPEGILYPDFIDRYRDLQERLKQPGVQVSHYHEAATFPEHGMVASNFPHSCVLLAEMAWTDLPIDDLCLPEDVEREFHKTLIGTDKAAELADLWVGKEYSQEKKDAFLILLDVWALSAFVEDVEHLTDCELVEPCVLGVFDRLIKGESIELITKWSIQQLWQGQEADISRSKFIKRFAELTDEGAVEDRIKAWQKGKQLLTLEQILVVSDIVGIHQMIPLLVVAFLRSTNLLANGEKRPSWVNLDLAGDIQYWRERIRQAARDTPGLTMNPRGTFYLKPGPDQSPAE